jgi:hypothetical protein
VRLRIGIDFDNTIVNYDRVFASAARDRGLIDPSFVGGKRKVRDELLARSGGERDWMMLQGRVYGSLMRDAELVDGVAEFLRRCKDFGAAAFIISHKTEFGHFDTTTRANLHGAAYAWMRANGFFDEANLGLSLSQVFFETTRDLKLKRVAAQSCTHFIDDLEEVLLEPAFPMGVERILYDPSGGTENSDSYRICRSWADIDHAIFN